VSSLSSPKKSGTDLWEVPRVPTTRKKPIFEGYARDISQKYGCIYGRVLPV
jgi:hypothetical protein